MQICSIDIPLYYSQEKRSIEPQKDLVLVNNAYWFKADIIAAIL